MQVRRPSSGSKRRRSLDRLQQSSKFSPRVLRGTLRGTENQNDLHHLDGASRESIQFSKEELQRSVDLRSITFQSGNSSGTNKSLESKKGSFGRKGGERERQKSFTNLMGHLKKDQKHNEDVKDSSSQPQIAWYQRIGLVGVTDTETKIVNSTVMQRETELMKTWSKAAQDLVSLRSDETSRRDDVYLQQIENQIEVLQQQEEFDFLSVDCLAAIVNRKERARLMDRQNAVTIANERQDIDRLYNERYEMIGKLYQQSRVRKKQLKEVFSEGPQLLVDFGNLLNEACTHLVSNQRLKLLLRMQEEQLDIGRFQSTDATNKLHRKIVLNKRDMEPNLALSNGALTVTNNSTPTQSPTWCMVRATEGPWPVQRFDRVITKDLVLKTLEKLEKHIIEDSASILAALATVLDSVHPGNRRLHAEVRNKGGRATSILQSRLEKLGYTKGIVDGKADNLDRIHKVEDLRQFVVEILQKMLLRIDVYARFYFEIHTHQKSVGRNIYVDCATGKISASDDGEHSVVKSGNSSRRPSLGRKSSRRMKRRMSKDNSFGLMSATGSFRSLSRESSFAAVQPSMVMDIGASDLFMDLHEVYSDEEDEEEHEETEMDEKKRAETIENALKLLEEQEREKTPAWIIGWTLGDVMPDLGTYPGSDERSFGLRDDGNIMYGGKAYSYCKSLHKRTVVGFLADLITGSLSVYADGRDLGVAFGVDSIIFDANTQQKQGEIIRSKHLIPSFSLQQVKLSFQNIDIGLSKERRMAKSITRSLSSSKMVFEGSIPMMKRTSSYTMAGVSNTEDDSSISLSEAKRIASRYLIENAAFPALSVNFGGFAFAHQPADTHACDKYLTFQSDFSDANLTREIQDVKNKIMKKQGEVVAMAKDDSRKSSFLISLQSEENDRIQEPQYSTDSERIHDHLLELQYRRALDYRFTTDQDDTIQKARTLRVSDGFSGIKETDRRDVPWFPPQNALAVDWRGLSVRNTDDKEVQQYAMQENLSTNIRPAPQWTSWSNFPPQIHREKRARVQLQYAARRFLGRRMLKRRRYKMERACRLVQRLFRKILPGIRENYRRASLRIQAIWRGVLGRRLTLLVKEYDRLPDDLHLAAVTIQCMVRKHNAFVEIERRIEELSKELERHERACCKIQKIWRCFRQVKLFKSILRQVKYAKVIQRIYRGHRGRLGVYNEDKVKAIKLSLLMKSIKQRGRQHVNAIHIQRLWRGHQERQDAKIRRSVYTSCVRTIERAYRRYRLAQAIFANYDYNRAMVIQRFFQRHKKIRKYLGI
eukprot:g4103.t1